MRVVRSGLLDKENHLLVRTLIKNKIKEVYE